MGERPDDLEPLEQVESPLDAEREMAPVEREEIRTGTPYTGIMAPTYTGTASEEPLPTTPEATADIQTEEKPDDVEAVRAQIEETRAGLSETIDAIQEKLSPANLAQQAKETVKDATVGRAQQAVSGATDTASGFGSTIASTIRENPVPAALAGMGLGWLIVKMRDQGPSSTGYRPAYTSSDMEAGQSGSMMDRAQAAGQQAVSQAQDKAGQVVGQAQASAQQAAGKVQEAMGSATDSVQQAMSTAGTTAQQAASTVGNSTIVDTIQRNPVPAVLAGVGLGWLILSHSKQQSASSQPRAYPPQAYGYGYQPGAGREDTSGSAMDQVQATAQQAVSQAQDAASQAMSQAQDTAGQAMSQAQNTAGQVMNQAQQRAGQLGAQAQTAASGFQQMLQENPLSVGALAVALGAAVGLAVPKTSKEDQLMGQAKDTLVQRAQETAQQIAPKVQSVAQEAVGAAKDAAKQEAQDQGLTQ